MLDEVGRLCSQDHGGLDLARQTSVKGGKSRIWEYAVDVGNVDMVSAGIYMP